MTSPIGFSFPNIFEAKDLDTAILSGSSQYVMCIAENYFVVEDAKKIRFY